MLTQQKWYGKNEQKVAAFWLDTEHARRLFLDRAERYVVLIFNDASGNAVGLLKASIRTDYVSGACIS
jgi:hypothetical protein